MKFTKLPLLILCLALIFSCKKDPTDSTSTSTTTPLTIPPISTNYAADSFIVFTNGTDPRLAQIKTAEHKNIIFFGQRDATGKPIKLTGYSMSKLPDTTKFDFVSFDDSEHYENIILNTGEGIHIDYNIKDSIKLIVKLLDTTIGIMKPYSLSAYSKKLSPITFGSIGKNSILGLLEQDVKVQVKAVNNFDQSVTDLGGSVTVLIFSGLKQSALLNDYLVPTVYDPATKMYSTSLKSVGYNYSGNAIQDTYELILKAIGTGCTDGPNRGPSVPDLIESTFCDPLSELFIQYPALGRICELVSGLSFICSVNSKINNENFSLLEHALDMLKSVTKSAHEWDLEAKLYAYSFSNKYGFKSSDPLSVHDILGNINSPDFTITYNYDEVHGSALGNYQGIYTFDPGSPYNYGGLSFPVHNEFTSGTTNPTGNMYYGSNVFPLTGEYSPPNLKATAYLRQIESDGLGKQTIEERWFGFDGTLVNNVWSGKYTQKWVTTYTDLPTQTINLTGTFITTR